MRVALFGATGVLGRNVVPRLQERGHAVRAIVQDERRAERLACVGVDAVVGDLFDADSVRRTTAGCDALLHLATRIPASSDPDAWKENDRIRRDGTRNLVAAAEANGIARYVQQSIVMLYGDQGDAEVDESVPPQPNAIVGSAVDMEHMVRASSLNWTMLRGGYFYGPGTGFEDRLRDAARAGTLAMPGDGSGWISLIHIADMARAVVTATESAPPHSIYNVVDDAPPRYADLFAYVAAQIGTPAPAKNGPPRPSARCSNGHIKRELGWTPAYPSFRSGFALTA